MRLYFCLSLALILSACGANGVITIDRDEVFTVSVMGSFNEPWALALLPDGSLLVTEKQGRLQWLQPADSSVSEISGMPSVAYGGQGGLGDVVLHPGFAENRLIYLSYAEADEHGNTGAAVARARLVQDEQAEVHLAEFMVIWRQEPKVRGGGHYGHRLRFDQDGYLWITSGERQKFEPAQEMTGNLGKIIRLHDDGSVPSDNPFVDQGEIAGQVWSLGHRNPLGIAFDAEGRLWQVEMGPRGGDELNLVERGGNYGYPIVSDGRHYNFVPIPNHHTRPEFQAPAIVWNPVISPSSLVIYAGTEFPSWRGNALIGGLSSESLIRVALDGTVAAEVERIAMGERIRGLAEGPDGAIWVLEDQRRGRGGRLLRLSAP
jgi:aldose sugar dehydrogenase